MGKEGQQNQPDLQASRTQSWLWTARWSSLRLRNGRTGWKEAIRKVQFFTLCKKCNEHTQWCQYQSIGRLWSHQCSGAEGAKQRALRCPHLVSRSYRQRSTLSCDKPVKFSFTNQTLWNLCQKKYWTKRVTLVSDTCKSGWKWKNPKVTVKLVKLPNTNSACKRSY